MKVIIIQSYTLLIMVDGSYQNIPYLSPNWMRMLVGVATNPNNDNKEIIELIIKKYQGYLALLTSCSLSPKEIIEEFDIFS